ncbi:MAG TPA: PA2779 family protein [Thermoanaerobaculales bacterium]|nr:PA2779 family protein [Thermoanaerobaculales bacterium]HPA79548.1 PA2779 family protein [Thermoanaerobaculales bacterium]HQL31310.1 PA2779 family protein [Thermoanaerobaculales bacterium]HQN95355.1 PA2779 family protein [Thermoanaerobaculales bacterium]HQP42175.1 PA2779 family protein [Thermoanaerobaculales bacterium]
MTTRNATTLLVLAAAALAAPGLPADDSVSTLPDALPATAAFDPETVAEARSTVADLLARHGLSPEQVDQRLSELTDEDLIFLAQHRDQVQEGGEQPPDYIWALLGVFLVVAIVAAIL